MIKTMDWESTASSAVKEVKVKQWFCNKVTVVLDPNMLSDLICCVDVKILIFCL